MKKILDFFKYFFCTSNRFIVSTIVLILIGIKIFSSGFAGFLSFAFEIIVAFVGAMILTVIEIIPYTILQVVWYQDTPKERTGNEEPFSTNFLWGLYFANLCALLYLFYKGTISWQ